MVKIESVTFGEVKINGKTYFSDVIAWWDENFEEIEKFHVFDEDFYFRLMKRDPEIIIVANGLEHDVKVEPAVREFAEKDDVLFFHEDLEKALEIFHAFVKEGRKAVIVIHNM